jgi:hypothetical protein
MGERSKVLQQFYRKHVALDKVPLYCSICKCVTLYKTELENHVKQSIYPHKATVNAMLANNEIVNESTSLLQNIKNYFVTESDITRLSKEESNDIFTKRTSSYCSSNEKVCENAQNMRKKTKC